MFIKKHGNVTKKDIRFMCMVALGFGIASLIVSLLLPQKYRADAQVFIIPSSGHGTDPYTAIKSTEKVAENIVHLVKTDDFYNKVIASGVGLDTAQFDTVSVRKRRKAWQKTIDARVIFGTGIVQISTYHTDQVQAKAYARAAANALSTRSIEYVGQFVGVKLVNNPIVSRWPARPNLVINIVIGLLIGLLYSGVSVIRKKHT